MIAGDVGRGADDPGEKRNTLGEEAVAPTAASVELGSRLTRGPGSTKPITPARLGTWHRQADHQRERNIRIATHLLRE
jgi:hypothetical protein